MAEILRLLLDHTDPLGVAVLCGSDNPRTVSGGLNAATGTVYLQRTTGRVYLKVGSATTAWKALTNEFLSAYEFGAVGDGVVDDTTPIQAALTEAAARGGGLVLLGNGIFKTTATLIIAGGVTLAGNGNQSATEIRCTANVTGIKANGAVGGARNVTIRDLFLNDTLIASRTVGHGIDIDGTTGGASCTLERVGTTGFLDGVRLTTAIQSKLIQVRCNSAKNDAFGLYGTCTSTVFDNTYASGATRHGYYLNGLLQYLSFLNTACDVSGGDGYHIDAVGGACVFLTFNSPGAEGNVGHSMYFKDGYGHVINAPNITGASGTLKDGIRFDGTQNVTVNGGEVANATGYGVNALTSATPQAAAAIVLNGVNFFANATGEVNDPNAAVTRRLGKQFSVGKAAVNATETGRLSTDLTAATNLGAPAEGDLITYALPGNTLVSAGQGVRVNCWGITAANANAKTIRFYVGGTLVLTLTGALNAGKWEAEVLVFWSTASNAQRFVARGSSSAAAVMPSATNEGTLAVDMTTAVTIKATGQSAANGDVQQNGMLREVLT